MNVVRAVTAYVKHRAVPEYQPPRRENAPGVADLRHRRPVRGCTYDTALLMLVVRLARAAVGRTFAPYYVVALKSWIGA